MTNICMCYKLKSINLALSFRGLSALEKALSKEELKSIMSKAIEMPKRVIHSLNGGEYSYALQVSYCLIPDAV